MKVSKKLKKLEGKAVVVVFKDPNCDWKHYRLERVSGSQICLTGMTNDEGDPHDGSWVPADVSEIRSVKRRK